MWNKLPDFAPKAPSKEAVAGDSMDLLEKWGAGVGEFVKACALKCVAVDKRPERRYFGLSLMQLPISEFERRDCLETAATHFMAYVHWDSVAAGWGRRLFLEGNYIKYSQPTNKRYFDMS